MAKYRKRPVVIEAKLLTKENWEEIEKWCAGQFIGNRISNAELDCLGLNIHTIEGTMFAQIGDWVIKGVKGEFYPCKPDIFAATYELVEESGVSP